MSPLLPSEAHRPAPQDLTLTILGDYVYDGRRSVWSGGLVRLLETFEFTTASARLALSRLARRGLIRGCKRGRRTYYELSDAGHRLLTEGQAEIFGFGRDRRWDGLWTILAFSLPEERRADRERLRKRLRFLGFASLHDGTWISPRDRAAAAETLLRELGLEREAHVFRGAMHHGPEVAEVIAGGWDLGSLAQRYARYVAAFGPYVRPEARDGLTDEEAFVVRTLAIHEFKRFPSLDPDLPDDLVGGRWARAEAVATFREVYDGLAEPGQRHFAAVTGLVA